MKKTNLFFVTLFFIAQIFDIKTASTVLVIPQSTHQRRSNSYTMTQSSSTSVSIGEIIVTGCIGIALLCIAKRQAAAKSDQISTTDALLNTQETTITENPPIVEKVNETKILHSAWCPTNEELLVAGLITKEVIQLVQNMQKLQYSFFKTKTKNPLPVPPVKPIQHSQPKRAFNYEPDDTNTNDNDKDKPEEITEKSGISKSKILLGATGIIATGFITKKLIDCIKNKPKLNELRLETNIPIQPEAVRFYSCPVECTAAIASAIAGASISGPIMPVIAGAIAVGLAIHFIRDKKASNKKRDDNNDPNNNDPNDPDKDPDEDPKKKRNVVLPNKKHPNGIYEENPKHHPNAKEGIGKPPRDGQKALDESIEIPKKDYRIAIQDKKIVVLKKHSSGKYHGYIEENYDNLHESAKQALYKSGFIKNPKTGRISK